MDPLTTGSATNRNITLYPWFKFLQNLTFWQAVWFLFFQGHLSASEAVLIYVIYDVATTIFEVPSGFMSDRVGRRFTLLLASAGMIGSAFLQAGAEGFPLFAIAQVLLGAGMAFSSGTDTALLYESLEAEGRSQEVEVQELRAWRFSFAALALSAVTGGAASLIWDRLPFLLSGLSYVAMLVLVLRFVEPRRAIAGRNVSWRSSNLASALRHPVLLWLFALSVLMYGFSHLPFVFGQPFIEQALEQNGFAANAPIVSGAVTTLMMLISVGASLFAMGLRKRIGLPAILLLAFLLQILLVGVLATTASAIAIVFLALRMVPDSLSRPFVAARIHPLLTDGTRATYLSIQSLCGRIFFAASLYLASGAASRNGAMVHDEIRGILAWYLGVGVLAFLGLLIWSVRLPIEPGKR